MIDSLESKITLFIANCNKTESEITERLNGTIDLITQIKCKISKVCADITEQRHNEITKKLELLIKDIANLYKKQKLSVRHSFRDSSVSLKEKMKLANFSRSLGTIEESLQKLASLISLHKPKTCSSNNATVKNIYLNNPDLNVNKSNIKRTEKTINRHQIIKHEQEQVC